MESKNYLKRTSEGRQLITDSTVVLIWHTARQTDFNSEIYTSCGDCLALAYKPR